MARIAQLAVCASTAVSAADVPQLRGRQLQGQLGDCYECTSHGYTGYNHKDSGSPPPSGYQWNDPVDGTNDDWWQCAEKCSNNQACQGWTFVYNGDPSVSQRECWLKSALQSMDPAQWADNDNDISGLSQSAAGLQLQGQLEDCYECVSHGYTGYNHKDSGSPEGQWNEPVYGTNDDWWQCAEKCSNNQACQGWTFVYNGDGTSQFDCWLKPQLQSTDPAHWDPNDNDISGLSQSAAGLQLPGQLEAHGYTGYNHKDSGSPEGQWNEPVYGTNDDWWQCAEKCSNNQACQGWTFVYNGDGTSQFDCWLKPQLQSTDPAQWGDNSNDISGLSQ